MGVGGGQLAGMEKEVEVKVMTWGSRGWIQVEVIMDEGWDTPKPPTIQDNSSRPEEEFEEYTTQEEENEVFTTKEECKTINVATPSLKKVNLPSLHQVEKYQQKCWEK